MGRLDIDVGRIVEGVEVFPGQNVQVRKDVGIFGRRQRRWAWLGFILLALHAPVAALLLPDDSWLFSITVASLVAFVIIVDDVERGKVARE
jgi:hypothetical protein